jgi:hypothetical protein
VATYIGNQPRTTVDVDSYSGNGVTTNFTLREVPATQAAVWVFIDGVRQATNAYSIVSNTLTFTEPPQSGTNNIQILFIGETTLIRTLDANSVSTLALQDNSVTSAKIAPGTVIAADILDGTVDNNKLVTANITGDKLVANTITAREIADGAILQNNITNGAVTASKLADTTVTPGTYGGTENIPVIIVDQQGRLTSAANAAVAIGDSFTGALLLSGT